MEEFWNALPSLRSVVQVKGNWGLARTEAWELLYDTLMGTYTTRFCYNSNHRALTIA